MSEQAPGHAPGGQPSQPRGTLRVVGLVAVGVGLAALADAAFVLSYAGIHAVALQAGVSHRLARGYPLILDVLLVVILAAALALRSAGWPSKLLAWASLLALLAAAAGADALHAAGKRLPARPAAVTAAVLPWALVLIAFVLLLAMLRHARLRRLAQPGGKPVKSQPQEPSPQSTQPLVPGFPARTTPADAGHGDTLSLVIPRPVTPEVAADSRTDLAIDMELAPDDPSTDAAADPDSVASDTAASDTAASDTAASDTAASDTAASDTAASDTAESDTVDQHTADPDTVDLDAADAEMPVFHRMWSAPVPPDGGR
jgi:Protein of unknown function (DUF2637)